jgi:hypothetical protein
LSLEEGFINISKLRILKSNLTTLSSIKSPMILAQNTLDIDGLTMVESLSARREERLYCEKVLENLIHLSQQAQ